MTGPDTAAKDKLSASPPIFKNPLLDKLTRIHPAVPVVVYAPVIVYLLVLAYHGAIVQTSLLVVLGYGLWTLLEYWGHRTVFHFEPAHPIGARLHWLIHGVHHDHPNDALRLVMPLVMSVPILTAACLIFGLVLDGPAWAATSAGFIAGYLGYDMTHYYLHHVKPRTRLGRALKARHMHHHFRDDSVGYGVSAPWWDVVFGTSPGAPLKQKRP